MSSPLLSSHFSWPPSPRVRHRPASGIGEVRPGAVRGRSRQNAAVPRRAQRRVHPPVRSPASPRDRDARFGRRHVPGAGSVRSDGAAIRGEPWFRTVTRPARAARMPRRAARVSGCSAALLTGLRQDGALRHRSGGGETPQRHRQPAGRRHGPPFPRTPVAVPEPLRQRAVRLVQLPAPRHPRKAPARH